MPIRKADLRDELLAVLTAQLERARTAHASAVAGAIDDEARPENDKDTRGLEQSYLARGQARRVAELEAAVAGIAALELVDLGPGASVVTGAVVTVEEDGSDS